MKVSGGNNNVSNAGIKNLYNTLYQGKMAMHNNRLSSDLFPTNNVKGEGAFNMDAMQYISEIKSASSALTSALKDLSGSAFSQRTMVSSDTDVMTVDFTGSSVNNINDMSVRIDQIAMGQLNEGARLSTTALYNGDRGSNRFAIETGGKTTQLSINVMAGDSNRDVQQKMATAINNAGLGLRATVETDSQTNMSILRVESTNVGTDERNAFTITDITGNAAAQTGANDVSRERQDAIYSINGSPEQTSRSNTVDLGNGINATFKASSGQNVTISRGQSMGHIRNAVESMVRSYNNLFSSAAGNAGDPRAQSLASRLMNITGAYSGPLASIGIGFDISGRMTIDSQRMEQAQSSGRLEQFFTENRGRSFGFSATLGRLASSVSNNTASFVSSSTLSNTMNQSFAYSGLGDMVKINSINSGSVMDFTL